MAMVKQDLDMLFGGIKILKIAIYQPSFIPWLGYFDLFLRSDVFVFYDDVQFTKRDWRTRNRIRTDRGWLWLSIPVRLEKHYFEYKINEVRIDYSQDWIGRHLKTFLHYYKRSKFFDDIMNLIESVYKKKHKFLSDLITDIFLSMIDYMECPKIPKVVYSHKMTIPSHLRKTERLLYIIKAYFPETNEYLTGPTAKNYLDERLFEKSNLKVVWHEYAHPFYNQLLWGTKIFLSHLSIVDLLFNHGKMSCNILLKKIVIEKPKDIIIVNANDVKDGKLRGGLQKHD